MDGPLTFIILCHHGIADPLPVLVYPLEEPLEIKEGKRDSSLWWTLCTSREIPSYEVDEPTMVPYKTEWRRHQDAAYWFDPPLATWIFQQTMSNAISLNDSMPAIC